VSVSIDNVLVREKSHSAADLNGHIVVLGVEAGVYFGFNDVASDIWRMLSEPRRVGDIFTALSQSHDVDTDTLSRDVLPFLQRLIEQGLARRFDPDDAA
jgi:hypothetical protein